MNKENEGKLFCGKEAVKRLDKLLGSKINKSSSMQVTKSSNIKNLKRKVEDMIEEDRVTTHLTEVSNSFLNKSNLNPAIDKAM